MTARRNKESLRHSRSQSADRDLLRRILVSAAAAVLLAALYGMIFRFSAQDAEESGSLSQFVSEKCVDIMNVLAGSRWSEAKRAGLAEYIEHPVRKLAHFSEYAYMGVLVYVLLSQWLEKGRRRNLLTAVWVFFSAAGDEFHQYFVPGRYASFMDVLLDTCGGVFGMLFCICTAALCRRHAEKKRRKKEPDPGREAQDAVKAADADAEVLTEETGAEAEVPAEKTGAEANTPTEKAAAEAESAAEKTGREAEAPAEKTGAEANTPTEKAAAKAESAAEKAGRKAEVTTEETVAEEEAVAEERAERPDPNPAKDK